MNIKTITLILTLLCLCPCVYAQQSRELNDIGQRLANSVPKPITVVPDAKPPQTSTVREQILRRFMTPQGLCIAGVTLVLTLLICRPRKPKSAVPKGSATGLVARFRESMVVNYERWHDGIGYDVHLLDQATPAEREEIEAIVLAEPLEDWLVVEALARLHTPRSIERIRATLAEQAGHEVKIAICEYAADLVTPEQRSAILIHAVQEAALTRGIPQALRQIAVYHPPEVMQALLQAALRREGEVAIHCAAMLLFLHGKASSIFDYEHMPFLQRFLSKSPETRAAVHHELRALIGL